MDIITAIAAARALSDFVPGLARLLGGERAGAVAEKVIETAKQITGQVDPAAAAEAIRANGELQVKLQESLAPVLIAAYEAETRQLETVNETMRRELASEDKYVKRWRPTLGYVVTLTWGLQMGALSIVIVMEPASAVAIITAMGSLSVMWGIALSILGVSVNARSKDKQIAAGQEPPVGLLDALAQRIAGRSDK